MHVDFPRANDHSRRRLDFGFVEVDLVDVFLFLFLLSLYDHFVESCWVKDRSVAVFALRIFELAHLIALDLRKPIE